MRFDLGASTLFFIRDSAKRRISAKRFFRKTLGPVFLQGIVCAIAFLTFVLPDSALGALGRSSTSSFGMPRLGPGRPRFTFAPYLQDVSSEGVVVAFSTDVATTGTVRVYASAWPNAPEEAFPGGEPLSKALQAVYSSPPNLHHRVRLVGLRPGTRYRYTVAVRRLTDPAPLETLTSVAEFSTAPQRGSFVFLVYGDSRDRDADHASVIHAMLPEHADLVLQTGDMVSRASDEAQWRRYFAAAAPLMRSTPLYPALGNHELRGEPDALHFHRLFVLPSGSLAYASHRRRPVYYAFRYSNSLFLILDGNAPNDHEQAAWLERKLQSAQADSTLRHTFAFVHQPPYAVGAYCGSERLVRRLVPILQRYAIRAVFAGHEHAYQHLERAGLRYFISGGGGAPLYYRSQACNFEDDMALRMFRAEHHYLRVQVDGDSATLLAINKYGGLMERVQLHEPLQEAPPAPLPPRGLPPLDSGDEEDNVPDLSPQAPRPYEAPVVGVSATAPPPKSLSARRLMNSDAGPMLLLWLSSIALLAGLLVRLGRFSPHLGSRPASQSLDQKLPIDAASGILSDRES